MNLYERIKQIQKALCERSMKAKKNDLSFSLGELHDFF